MEDEELGNTIAISSGAVEPRSVGSDHREAEVAEELEEFEDHDDHNTIVGDDQTGQQEKPPQRLEMARTTSSAGPPYTVFSLRQKQFIVVMVAAAGFISPLSASIYFPALNALAVDLHVTNGLINLTITSYMIFQGLAPAFIGDLSDMSGRRPAYVIGFIIYLAACIGIALQNNFAALFVLRCLQSTGSSGTVALGIGVVADITTSSERGYYIGWATGGMLVAPAIGPVIGGLLAQYLGWRAIFWFLVIIVGVFSIPLALTFPETARNVVGNGSIPPPAWNMSLINYLAMRKTRKSSSNELERVESRRSAQGARDELAKRRKMRFPNPIKTLKICMEKDMFVLLICNSIIYMSFMDLNASLPYLFGQIYGFDDLKIGLSFIPFGVGCFLASIINGKILDVRFRRIAKQEGFPVDKKKLVDLVDFPIEKARIPVALILISIGAAAQIAYGWVLQYNVHVAAPLVLLFIMGYCLNGGFGVISVLLVDNFPDRPATATAANNLVRCLMGAAGTAVIIYMIDGMGRGWCFTFLALLSWASLAVLGMMIKWGPAWRRERHDKLARQKEVKLSLERLKNNTN